MNYNIGKAPYKYYLLTRFIYAYESTHVTTPQKRVNLWSTASTRYIRSTTVSKFSIKSNIIANKFRARDSLMSQPDHINSKERNTPEERRRATERESP